MVQHAHAQGDVERLIEHGQILGSQSFVLQAIVLQETLDQFERIVERHRRIESQYQSGFLGRGAKHVITVATADVQNPATAQITQSRGDAVPLPIGPPFRVNLQSEQPKWTFSPRAKRDHGLSQTFELLIREVVARTDRDVVAGQIAVDSPTQLLQGRQFGDRCSDQVEFFQSESRLFRGAELLDFNQIDIRQQLFDNVGALPDDHSFTRQFFKIGIQVAQVDRLFSKINPLPGEFSFDENVARVFDDMISRSIPLYADVQRSIPVLADLLDHDPIQVVDLGCSTGTSLIHLARSLPGRNLQLTGIDNSSAMLKKCTEKIAAFGLERQIRTTQADVQDYPVTEASIVLMNYTLQFIAVEKRLDLLTRIHRSLKPAGFLLVSEKVMHAQPAMDDALVELYFEFKRRQGYSELEISRKRDALENVLVPLTIDENLNLLREAGFERTELLLKWFNFATFVCYR